MKRYLHEDTSEGVMSAVYRIFKDIDKPDHSAPISIKERNMLDEYIEIETDIKISKYLFDHVRNKISDLAEELVYNASLSYEINTAKLIFEYIKKGIKIGKDIEFAYADDIVLEIWHRRDNVLREYMKYLGFLRFNKIENDIFVSEYTPKNNINLLLAEHFSDRMRYEKWIIIDRVRDKAVIYNEDQYFEIDFDSGIKVKNSFDDDLLILWKRFLDSVTIEDRNNFKLQRNNMPLRYRGHMKEFKL